MNLAFFRGLTNAPAIRTDKVRLKIFISVISIIISSILLCLSFKFQWLDGKVIAIVMIGAAVFWIILLIWAERKIKYVFIIPTTVILIIITIIPFIYLLNLSVHNVKAVTFNKEWVFVGLRNYLDILNNPEVFSHLILTLEFVIVTVGLEFIIGMGFALMLNREFKGKSIAFSLFLMPMMSTPIVVGLMWKYILDMNSGFMTRILELLNLPIIPWLTATPLPVVKNIPMIGPWLVQNLNFNYAFLSLIITDVWQWTPFMFLILLAGLSSVPVEPYEAAEVDGASFWQKFRYITLPQMKNIILIALLLRIMDALKVFDTIWALFGSSILMRTLNMYIFNEGITKWNYSVGAAMSVFVLIFVSVISNFFIRPIYLKEK